MGSHADSNGGQDCGGSIAMCVGRAKRKAHKVVKDVSCYLVLVRHGQLNVIESLVPDLSKEVVLYTF